MNTNQQKERERTNMVKEKSPYGALFFDYKNTISKDSTDQNLTVYGNNTTNKTI